jgi:hypothetical protein
MTMSLRIWHLWCLLCLPMAVMAVTVSEAETKYQQALVATAAARAELVAARKAALAAQANAPLAAEVPQLVVPRLTPAPTIDGVVGDAEWARAVSLTPGTGAANTGQYLKARPGAIFHLGWDPENVYVAVKIPMRDGEQPSRLHRKPQRDSMDCWETLGEFYIDTGGNGSIGLPCRYQFIGTATGNQWDREEQYTIGQNMISWDGTWAFKQSLSADGKFWMGEFAVPRTTVYAPQPIKDGTRWKLGIAASLMYPWQWCGLYGWPITATFRDAAPAIRLDGIEGGLMTKRATGNLTIVNTTAQPLAAKAVLQITQGKETPVRREVPVALAPGETFIQRFDEDAAAVKDQVGSTYAVQVLTEAGSLFTFSRGFAFNDPLNGEGLKVETRKEAFPLTCRDYPLTHQVVSTVDVFDLPARDRVKSARLTVRNAAGTAVVSRTITDFSYGLGVVTLPTPAALAPGEYTLRAEILDAGSTVLATNSAAFVRKDHAKAFPWLGNTVGMDDVVPRIFAPVGYKDGVITGYQKAITLNAAALPATVKAAAIDLLASPVRLCGTAQGQPFELAPVGKARPGTLAPTHVDFRGQAAGGPVAATVQYRLDYDGTARVEVTLSPRAKGQAASLDELRLVIPFRGDAATHYMAVGNSMRQSNRAGKIPGAGKTGVVWKSTEIPFQNMTVGSFVPIIHVGNLSSGITWFADSDQGWWPTDAVPAQEIVRTPDGTVELVCHLAGAPVTFNAPRTIVFGLCTVPVRAVTPYRTTAHTIGFGFTQESGRWDPKKTPGQVYARVYPDDPAKMRAWVDALHADGQLEKCYVENTSADYWGDEYAYFASEWSSPFARAAADNKLYWTEKFIRDCHIDGYYFDNIFPRQYGDPAVTSAYVLPDGRVQPGYDFWGMRDYLRRIRVTFEKYRNPTAIVIHNTDFQFAPVCAYADLVMGGENPTPMPGGPDFMEMWPREWMDVMYNPYLWGYALSHLYHYNWSAFKDDLGQYDQPAALKGHRAAMATMLNHGVEFFQGIEYQSYAMPAYKLFKALPGMLEFLPSWRTKGLVKHDNPNLDVACFRKADALLILVTNYGKTDLRNQRIWFDFPALLPVSAETGRVRELFDIEGMTDTWGIVDPGPRAGGTIHATTIRMDVRGHDWRGFLLLNAFPAQGAGF